MSPIACLVEYDAYDTSISRYVFTCEKLLVYFSKLSEFLTTRSNLAQSLVGHFGTGFHKKFHREPKKTAI